MDFALPPVGEGLIEVELTKWLVAPGQSVVRGQPLAEVMSDKAAMEVPAPFAGTVTAVVGSPGDKVAVGALLLRYTPAGETILPAPTPVLAPELPTPAARNGDHPPDLAVTPAEPPAAVAPPAAPSVRMLARKLGVDLAAVAGTGPDGRILVGDLAAHVASVQPDPSRHDPVPAVRPDPTAPVSPVHPHHRRPHPPAPDYGKAGTKTKLVGLRRKIAEQMVLAKTAPHFTYVDEADVSELVRVRSQLKDTFAHAGLKLTVLPFVVKAVARALAEVPVVNATFDAAADELTLHAGVHVGVAVAAAAGLVVPVVKDADKKDIAAIAADIERLADAVRAGRVGRADLSGGTFTVSSIGGIGGLIATPILNVPEVGILAVGKIVRRPVYDDAGHVKPADTVYLSFSFDHRVIDGAVAAHFGNVVVRHLARPAALLLPDGFGR